VAFDRPKPSVSARSAPFSTRSAKFSVRDTHLQFRHTATLPVRKNLACSAGFLIRLRGPSRTNLFPFLRPDSPAESPSERSRECTGSSLDWRHFWLFSS
jgi:hypothetical protein